MSLLDRHSAEALFQSLPVECRIGTLSPLYVAADARRANDLEPVYFCHMEREKFWLHSFHLSPTPGAEAFDVQSPYGYGGPVSNCSNVEFLTKADAAYRQYCLDSRVAAEFVRLHPVISKRQPFYGETYFDRDTVVIELGETPPRDSYSTRARTSVRKAEKSGLQVLELPLAENIAKFAVFYREAMANIGAAEFYLFNDAYFKDMAVLPGVKLFAVIRDQEWLAAGLFFFYGETAEYHLSGTSFDGRNLGATNLLIDYAAMVAQKLNLTKLYLGGGTNSASDNPLLFFKKSFSNSLRPFTIGTRVHRQDLYDLLRKTHPKKYRSDRILFYRVAG